MDLHKIIVFGTGDCAINCEKLFSNTEHDIVSYVDNNKDKHGNVFLNKPVLSPDSLGGLSFDYVVIASSYFKDIRQQLLSMNVPKEKIAVYPGFDQSDGVFEVFEGLRRFNIFNALIMPITEACHLKCAHCLREEEGWNPGRTRTLQDFQHCLGQFEPNYFRFLNLNGTGEPLLVKEILDYLYIARKMGWREVGFVTSGSLLRKAVLEEMIAERLVSKIWLSLEAADALNFQKIRGFPFERFLKFLDFLNASISRYGTAVEVCFNVTYGMFNIRTLCDIVQLAAQKNISGIDLFPLMGLFNDDKNSLKVSTPSNVVSYFRFEDIFLAAKNLASSHNIRFKNFDENSFQSVCWEPYDTVFVNLDGGIYPCCSLIHPREIGNLKENKFLDVWMGDDYEKLLKAIKHNPGTYNYCKSCWKFNRSSSLLSR